MVVEDYRTPRCSIARSPLALIFAFQRLHVEFGDKVAAHKSGWSFSRASKAAGADAPAQPIRLSQSLD
jgi:hypothetical protein